MRFLVQTLFLLLTWSINLVSAMPAFTKIILPSCDSDSYRNTFSKTENAKEERVVKIGVNLLKLPQKLSKAQVFWKNKKAIAKNNNLVSPREEKWIDDLLDGGSKAVTGVGRHPNWVEVTDITNKVLAKKPHVLRMDINTNNTGFQGCHSKIALDDYVANNPTATFEFRNKVLGGSNNGVYEANPVIKLQNGTELVKTNNAGKSTFFPDTWNETKVLDEVEYAIANSHGKIPTKPNGNEYFGLSRDGKVEIHFYYNTNGTISSYFPVIQ